MINLHSFLSKFCKDGLEQDLSQSRLFLNSQIPYIYNVEEDSCGSDDEARRHKLSLTLSRSIMDKSFRAKAAKETDRRRAVARLRV